MDKIEELLRLEANRFTEDPEQMDEFSTAIRNIVSFQDYEDIKELCLGFEDHTYNMESMYELIHAIEGYLPLCGAEIYVTTLFQSLEESMIFGYDWMKRMVRRVLNSRDCGYYAPFALASLGTRDREAVKKILDDILLEAPDLESAITLQLALKGMEE